MPSTKFSWLSKNNARILRFACALLTALPTFLLAVKPTFFSEPFLKKTTTPSECHFFAYL